LTSGPPVGGTLPVENIFDAGQVTIHYAERAAPGPPVVLLHGIGRTWQDFLPVLPAFADCHVFALDLRGHGKSGRVPNRYRTADYSADVSAFLKNKVSSTAVIFGHSLGGIIALRVAASNPGAVRAIIVGDSVLDRDTLAHSMYQALFVSLYPVVIQGGSREQIAARLAKLEIPVPGLPGTVAIGDLPGNNEASLRKWAQCLQQLDPQALQATIDGSTFEDFQCEEVLRGVRCPALILQSNPELGGLMSESAIQQLQRHLPNVQVARFPLLGHTLHLQRAQPVIDAISKFMAAL
jgi:pimeloyl-ACP methyl ester carboxylesterase